MPEKKNGPGYAQALEELEGIIQEIESESVDVDVLAAKVKRASTLIDLLKGKLKSADMEVRKVLDAMQQQQADAASDAAGKSSHVEHVEDDDDDPVDTDERGNALF